MPRKSKVKLVNLPIGTKVRMVNCYESRKYGDKVWITRSDLWMLAGHKWCSWKVTPVALTQVAWKWSQSNMDCLPGKTTRSFCLRCRVRVR